MKPVMKFERKKYLTVYSRKGSLQWSRASTKKGTTIFVLATVRTGKGADWATTRGVGAYAIPPPSLGIPLEYLFPAPDTIPGARAVDGVQGSNHCCTDQASFISMDPIVDGAVLVHPDEGNGPSVSEQCAIEVTIGQVPQ